MKKLSLLLLISAFIFGSIFIVVSNDDKEKFQSPPTVESMDPFIGEIILFGGHFAPRGWAFCNGQLLSISSHQALFSILGTTYGGDGRTTFALPDLKNRVPVHSGGGSGLGSIKNYGSKPAVENEILEVRKKTVQKTQPLIQGVGLNYIICLQGVFPSRS